MPLRVECPSCLTQLSVRDEYLGRAVKCPKCGGLIPPSTVPQDPDSPPVAEPSPSPEQLDTAFKNFRSAPPSDAAASVANVNPNVGTSKPPLASSGDRPRRPDGRLRGESGDERPRRRPDRDDTDDDYRGRPRRRRRPNAPVSSGGGTGKVLAIIAVVMVLLCGGVGLGAFWVFTIVKEGVEKTRARIEEQMNPATQAKYDLIRLGMTRSDVDVILNYGFNRNATEADLTFAFRGDDAKLIADWLPKVKQNRVLIWQHGNDSLFIAFYPNADANGWVQMKAFMPAEGMTAHAGIADDEKFAEDHKLDRRKVPDPLEIPTVISAQDLGAAYAVNRRAADGKYLDRDIIIEGTIVEIEPSDSQSIGVFFVGVDFAVVCMVKGSEINSVLDHSRGQTIRLSGRCIGIKDTVIGVVDCRIVSASPDPGLKVTVSTLSQDFLRNESAAAAKYKDKPVVITDAVVAEFDVNEPAVVLTVASKKGLPHKVRATYSAKWSEWFSKYKPGDRITIRGICVGLEDDVIVIEKCWPTTLK